MTDKVTTAVPGTEGAYHAGLGFHPSGDGNVVGSFGSETKGGYRVGRSFNPSGDPVVDCLKELAALLIDMIDNITVPEDTGATAAAHISEISRLKALAQTHVETAAMYAVKAQTKPEPCE